MKTFILTFAITFISLSLFAQRNYNEAMQQGNAALQRGDYTTAIQKYLIARNKPDGDSNEVQAKLNKVYAAIDAKQKELAQTKTALSDTTKELTQTKTALSDTTKVLKWTKKKLLQTRDSLKNVRNDSTNLQTELTQKRKDLLNAREELDQIKKFAALFPELSKKVVDSVFVNSKLTLKDERGNDINDSKKRLEHVVNQFLNDNIDKREEIISTIDKQIQQQQ